MRHRSIVFHFSVGLRYIRLMDVPWSLISLSSSKVLTLLVWYNDNDAYITSITSTAMDDRPRSAPPPLLTHWMWGHSAYPTPWRFYYWGCWQKFCNYNTGNAIGTLITITGIVIREITIPVMLSSITGIVSFAISIPVMQSPHLLPLPVR